MKNQFRSVVNRLIKPDFLYMPVKTIKMSGLFEDLINAKTGKIICKIHHVTPRTRCLFDLIASMREQHGISADGKLPAHDRK